MNVLTALDPAANDSEGQLRLILGAWVRAMKDLCRTPGTNHYDNMRNGTVTYKVVLFQRPAAT